MPNTTKTRKKESFGSLIADALEEAVAIKEGKVVPTKVSRLPLTSASDAVVLPAPEYTASRIRSIRVDLALSQTVFARVLNVSDTTVRAWEQGLRQPSGATCRLLELAEHHPNIVFSWVENRNKKKAARK